MADITTDQFYSNITVEFRLANNPDGTPGAIAPVQPGSIVWATSDPTVLTVTPNGTDNMSARSDPVGEGTARLSITADADTGVGVRTITGISEPVNVTLGASSMASVINFTFGPPTDKVVTPPPTP